MDSHEKALARGRQEMVFLLGQLDIARELDVVEPAHRLYNLALNKNFTRGRRTNQASASPTRQAFCASLLQCMLITQQWSSEAFAGAWDPKPRPEPYTGCPEP